MALTKPATAPKFEATGDDQAEGVETNMNAAEARVAAALAGKVHQSQAAEPVDVVETAPAAAASTSTTVALAKPAGGAVVASAASIMAKDPFKSIENQLRVGYGELTRLKVTNGNIVNVSAGNKVMGDKVKLDLISIQEHTVMSPGGKQGDKEALKYLKFSDDGRTDRESGELLTDWCARAKAAGYEEAKIVDRMILVGAIIDGGKCPEFVGDLIQLDLAPRSMNNFKTHRIGVAYKLGKKLLPADINPLAVEVYAELQNKNGNDWTDANFKPCPDVKLEVEA